MYVRIYSTQVKTVNVNTLSDLISCVCVKAKLFYRFKMAAFICISDLCPLCVFVVCLDRMNCMDQIFQTDSPVRGINDVALDCSHKKFQSCLCTPEQSLHKVGVTDVVHHQESWFQKL